MSDGAGAVARVWTTKHVKPNLRVLRLSGRLAGFGSPIAGGARAAAGPVAWLAGVRALRRLSGGGGAPARLSFVAGHCAPGDGLAVRL